MVLRLSIRSSLWLFWLKTAAPRARWAPVAGGHGARLRAGGHVGGIPRGDDSHRGWQGLDQRDRGRPRLPTRGRLRGSFQRLQPEGRGAWPEGRRGLLAEQVLGVRRAAVEAGRPGRDREAQRRVQSQDERQVTTIISPPTPTSMAPV